VSSSLLFLQLRSYPPGASVFKSKIFSNCEQDGSYPISQTPKYQFFPYRFGADTMGGGPSPRGALTNPTPPPFPSTLPQEQQGTGLHPGLHARTPLLREGRPLLRRLPGRGSFLPMFSGQASHPSIVYVNVFVLVGVSMKRCVCADIAFPSSLFLGPFLYGSNGPCALSKNY